MKREKKNLQVAQDTSFDVSWAFFAWLCLPVAVAIIIVVTGSKRHRLDPVPLLFVRVAVTCLRRCRSR
jgi:hypothetical protein